MKWYVKLVDPFTKREFNITELQPSNARPIADLVIHENGEVE